MTEFEICIDSVASARAALQAGANRVELCAGLLEGGTTPSLGMIKQVAAVLAGSSVELAVLVRPRGGDFVYSEDELSVMFEDINQCKSLGVQTIVIGCLLPHGEVDVFKTRRLVDAARPMSVTFHRAIDVCIDPIAAVDTIVSIPGITRILSSGGQTTALEGAPVLAAMVARAAGRIHIMAGGGVRLSNLSRIIDQSGVRHIHMSARKTQESEMIYRKLSVPMGSSFGPNEFSLSVADVNSIIAAREAAPR